MIDNILIGGHEAEMAAPHMKRSDYLAMLLRQRPEWLRSSMAEPTRHMTRTHVLLHAVALRRMNECD
jgi:hypothetical protein